MKCLAVGLKRNSSVDGSGGVKSHETDHSKASVLDLNIAASSELFFGLSRRQTKGVVKSGDHVLLKTKFRD
jgi:hypothetical protein